MVSSARQKARAPVAPGDVVAGRYRVVRVLASGGMGVVVEALHEQLKSKVALKFLHEHVLEHEHAKARFLREAMLAAKMNTEHIARLFDVGTLENGAPFVVMELLEGQDAAAYAKANAPLPIAEAAEIVAQACDAMVHAHALAVIHRDLKPHNLFITRRDNGTMLVKVLDFGVSKSVGGPVDDAKEDLSLTDSSVTVGSPLYMAPEQMRASRDATRASDIWSMGVILYELLSGRTPFDGSTVTELCLKVVNDPLPSILDLRPDIPDDLARVVERCLEKDPAKRFANMAMLAEALEPFAKGSGAMRGWQSQVATGDSLDLGDLPSESEVASDSSRARLLESGARRTDDLAPPSSRAPRRKVFAQGLASGATLTILGALVAIGVWLGVREPKKTATETRTETSAASTITTATATSTSTSTSMPTTAPTPTQTATASATAAPTHRSLPVASAHPSASASVPPRVSSPNGAPILH